MKPWLRAGACLALLALGWLLMAQTQCRRGSGGQEQQAAARAPEKRVEPAAGEERMLAREVRMPVELYPDGTVRIQLTAGTARMPPEGAIEAWNVEVDLFDPAGNQDGHMVTGRCVFNKEKNEVTSGSDVRFELKKGILITGTGFEWKASEQTVGILSNVTVVLSKDVRKKGTT